MKVRSKVVRTGLAACWCAFVCASLAGCSPSEEEQALEELHTAAAQGIEQLEEEQQAIDALGKRSWFADWKACGIPYDSQEDEECLRTAEEIAGQSIDAMKTSMNPELDNMREDLSASIDYLREHVEEWNNSPLTSGTVTASELVDYEKEQIAQDVEKHSGHVEIEENKFRSDLAELMNSILDKKIAPRNASNDRVDDSFNYPDYSETQGCQNDEDTDVRETYRSDYEAVYTFVSSLVGDGSVDEALDVMDSKTLDSTYEKFLPLIQKIWPDLRAVQEANDTCSRERYQRFVDAW